MVTLHRRHNHNNKPNRIMPRAPRSDSSATTRALRNGPSVRKLGRPDRKRINGSIIRAFFLTLILIAVALAALAVYLTAQIQSTNTRGTTGSNSDSTIRNDVRAMAASSTSQVSKAKSAIISSPNNNNNNNKKAKLAYPNGPKNDAKYAKDRVYCMVPFVWNAEMYNVIMQTWGRRCNVINFITDSIVMVEGKLQGDEIMHGDAITEDPTKGYKHYSEFPPGTFPDNVIFIDMTRPWTGCTDGKSGKPKLCRHIWEKMWQSWVYVGDHHLDEAEWFCKVDYDTFFFPENLQYYVRDKNGWDPYNEHHYFGLVLGHRAGHPSMVAGAATCWSHKTMADIAVVYKNMPKGFQGNDRYRCEDRPKASEEITTSMCLKKELNITAEPMLDDEMREYVMLDPYHNMLTWNRTEQGEWWYWQGKPANRGQMENCCAVRPMGMHKYKRREQIEVLEKQFYGPTNNKELSKLNERTRRYADKVRKAMGNI
mmetsp:Transcript_38318/g.70297  ORF Transcript_38318/g.70297 Transcript_38318/m.70297 type:complete len:482 (+) Transcript_38318:26-1471(+)